MDVNNAPPEPQLLLGLPPLALQVMLEVLSSSRKVALLRTCKEARAAVLQHAPRLIWRFKTKTELSPKAHVELCALLASRTERLHLVLDLTTTADEDIPALQQHVAALQFPTHTPPGHCCVKELEIRLPDKEGYLYLPVRRLRNRVCNNAEARQCVGRRWDGVIPLMSSRTTPMSGCTCVQLCTRAWRCAPVGMLQM